MLSGWRCGQKMGCTTSSIQIRSLSCGRSQLRFQSFSSYLWDFPHAPSTYILFCITLVHMVMRPYLLTPFSKHMPRRHNNCKCLLPNTRPQRILIDVVWSSMKNIWFGFILQEIVCQLWLITISNQRT